MYAKSKGNNATTVNAKALTSTPEASNGNVSFNNKLTQNDTIVNSESMQDLTGQKSNYSVDVDLSKENKVLCREVQLATDDKIKARIKNYEHLI